MTTYLIPKKDLPYNPDDINSVIKHAKKLEGSTLRKADSKLEGKRSSPLIFYQLQQNS